MNKQRIIILFTCIFFFGVIFRLIYWLSIELADGHFLDFPVYYRAVTDFVSRRDPYFYNLSANRHFGEIAFNYPPAALFGFFPFKFFALLSAEIVVSSISIIISLFLIFSLLKVAKIQRIWSHFFLLSSLFFLTDPVEMTLRIGQVNLIVVGLVFLSLFFYERKNKGLTILFFVWSFSLKFYPILLLPFFLIKKDYLVFFTSFFLFILLNILLVPNLFLKFMFNVLPEIAKNNLEMVIGDQSLYTFLMRLTGDPFISKICLFGLMAIIIFIVYYSWSKTKHNQHDLVFFSSIMMAISAISGFFSWQHQLVFAFPLILMLYCYFFQTRHKFSFIKQVFGFGCFILIWLIFSYRFTVVQLNEPINPFLASYQTVTIIAVIMTALIKRKSIC